MILHQFLVIFFMIAILTADDEKVSEKGKKESPIKEEEEKISKRMIQRFLNRKFRKESAGHSSKESEGVVERSKDASHDSKSQVSESVTPEEKQSEQTEESQSLL